MKITELMLRKTDLFHGVTRFEFLIGMLADTEESGVIEDHLKLHLNFIQHFNEEELDMFTGFMRTCLNRMKKDQVAVEEKVETLERMLKTLGG